ncbi:hypothetical protein AN965_03380 [Alkalicoccobacillus plakortidis]|uniref:Uncharacterized protein n=1 Tax=Alkalicoccobacillus plakortidis TaxID=444060 RepID=A0A9D5I252_9BACI|nr:hypothetical protein [Alkalicoccobacillus plakortidis]KQL58352.1 hypothetical protein AN965_03380 [Alkalicoccobacillus plakortidis]
MNMNIALDLKVSLGIILFPSVLFILSLSLKRFMVKIVKLYPHGHNEKFYEVTEHIAQIEIKSWITNKGITKEQIELQLLPYLDRILIEKNRFSLKTIVHLVLTSSILTVSIFLTNLMLTVFSYTSAYEEASHLFYLIVIIFFVILIVGFVIISIFFSFFEPPLSERTYLIIQRLFWQEISNKKSSILKVEDYRIPFFLSNKRDLFR